MNRIIFSTIAIVYIIPIPTYGADGLFIALRTGISTLAIKTHEQNFTDMVGNYKIAIGNNIETIDFEIEFSNYQSAAFDTYFCDPNHEICTTTGTETDASIWNLNIAHTLSFWDDFGFIVGVGTGIATTKEKYIIHTNDPETTDTAIPTAITRTKHNRFEFHFIAGAEYIIDDTYALSVIYRNTHIGHIRAIFGHGDTRPKFRIHEFIIGVKYMF